MHGAPRALSRSFLIPVRDKELDNECGAADLSSPGGVKLDSPQALGGGFVLAVISSCPLLPHLSAQWSFKAFRLAFVNIKCIFVSSVSYIYCTKGRF